jgi:hypothetical protein
MSYFGTPVALLHDSTVGTVHKSKDRSKMSLSSPNQNGLCWCQMAVPTELEDDHLCVLHFILAIEQDCAGFRRETAQGRTSTSRQSEIAAYVKATAMRLTEVATGRNRLSDELKKRILTTLLTLMNLQESLERSANRGGLRELRPSALVAG